ncbi:MAG: aconitate hydratase [Candidatus Woesearchaeota archaeon]
MFLENNYLRQFYENYSDKLSRMKENLKRPLTLSEKIIFSHIRHIPENIEKGRTEVSLKVDRVAMQDATAQMAILQFMLTGREKVAVPTTIHCDHLIQAHKGSSQDLNAAIKENQEVYDFLKSASNKYGIGFWNPGSGIIHQVVFENYAIPGALMIGTDSHTPNAGGLCMISIGVGGADAVDAMAGENWNIAMPKIIGIKLTGKLDGWTAPKDVILKVAELLTVKGGTGFILEYFGEGISSISATGRGTITNMGAEIGATTSIFPFDKKTAEYLKSTYRADVSDYSDKIKQDLQPDKEILEDPEKYFDKVIEISLSELKPMINGPHSPDLAHQLSDVGESAKNNGWPVRLSYALIGSCTNSSYEDMQRAASIARQAAEKGARVKCGFMITPGSEQIYRTIERDGLLEVFEGIGGIVLANACGPCIGQWKRDDIKLGDKNSIISSYNRNFKKRNDSNPETHAFVASPEIVTAYALAGGLDFNPLTDFLETQSGERFRLELPSATGLPSKGFVFDTTGYDKPTGSGNVIINPDSERLAFLKPFGPWNKEKDFKDLLVLVKAKGKCTTDHVSPAGKWLRFRGHLDKISDNLYSGAVNAFTDEAGTGKNIMTGEQGIEFSRISRHYNDHGRGWIAVGDSNYGEGSSREHAAMEPRHLGCRAIIAKSFARIAETNLKKQGLLPLWFDKEEDYDKIREDDLISINYVNIQVGKQVIVGIRHSDGTNEDIKTNHTYSEEQIKWFDAGSALDEIRKRNEENEH